MAAVEYDIIGSHLFSMVCCMKWVWTGSPGPYFKHILLNILLYDNLRHAMYVQRNCKLNMQYM